MRYLKVLLMVWVIGFGAFAMAADPPAGVPGGPPQDGSKNPLQDRLDAMAVTDKTDLPAKGAVEFVGSSMMEGWTEVAAHMAPMPAFNRAVGGSKTADILTHLNQLVLQYEPKVVVLYTGINDVSEGVSSATAADNIRKIIEAIGAGFPETRVIYIAMLNTSNRPDSSPLIKEANAGIKKYAEQNPHMTYLDVSPALVDDKGDTRPEFLTDDKTHYNSAAYEAMAKVVKPVAEKAWAK